MVLLLLFIYWNQCECQQIFLGKDILGTLSMYKNDAMEDDVEKEIMREMERERNNAMERNSLDLSTISNFREINNASAVAGMQPMNSDQPRYLSARQIKMLKHHQRSMTYDSMYQGANQSIMSKHVQGGTVTDKRWLMHQKLANFKKNFEMFDEDTRRKRINRSVDSKDIDNLSLSRKKYKFA